jgi:gamma-glutamyltranspeptidase/glutathione hydrolase
MPEITVIIIGNPSPKQMMYGITRMNPRIDRRPKFLLIVLMRAVCWKRAVTGLISAAIISNAAANQPIFARKAMVVAQEPLATDVGLAVMGSGGNAVDAAVAVGFALSVTYPFAGNIGGGGFMLVRMADGQTKFIDFRERAPAKATRDMYLDVNGAPTKDSLLGWRAAGVPGTVRGLELARNMFGRTNTISWQKLLKPAIDLASKGFPVSHAQMQSFRAYARALSQSNSPDSKRIFLKGGSFYEWQETFRQPELASTLERIARYGAKDFYEGKTARMIAEAMQRNGGLITLDDLRNYKALVREPLRGSYHGYDIITAPLPSSGGVCILQMLGILDETRYETNGAGSARSYHYLADVMRFSFADRNKYLGDPDFVKAPLSMLISADYLSARRAKIALAKATEPSQIEAVNTLRNEGSETTHFNVVDEEGNVVAVTYTLNDGYGSGVTVPGAGFLLNDEMDDFTAKLGVTNAYGLAQGPANLIEPGKRPLSSMSPTIILKDGKPFLVLGAPGGSRIITAVLQVIVNVLDFHMNIQDAIDFPRVHAQWNGYRLEVERGVSPDTIALLMQMGYEIQPGNPPIIARVEAILMKDGWLQGGHDTRGTGKTAGW